MPRGVEALRGLPRLLRLLRRLRLLRLLRLPLRRRRIGPLRGQIDAGRRLAAGVHHAQHG
ncbi:hypothetical protein [Phaeacidiphilus oryzae]|uniref:hypothetical protein n=1 Tax=Phaeacidiphilus oryzae TaxID=348818 RepID=UPI00126A59CC|nr:hypothetical protein [Phaeacidiphilus oryzae]